MTERIGLEAFFDTSKFKVGFAEYVSGMDKATLGTNRLTDAMEQTASPSVILANRITDLGNRVLLQQRQLGLYEQELIKLGETYGQTSAQAQRKQLQIDRLSVSIDKNLRTLGGYRQEVEASRQNLHAFEEEAKKTEHSLSRLDVVVGTFAGTTLGGAFKGAASGAKDLLIGLSREAFDAVASHERLTLAIETLTAKELLNSGQAIDMADAMRQAAPRAQELLGWVEQLAVKSPFTQEDIANTFRLAQAYGFTSEEAQRLTQVITDFTAGTGQSGIVGERLALALGQIGSKGRVMGQELNQLREAGLNVNAILEGMGFTLSDVEKGFVKADQFIEAVVQTLERDFQGAAERQTESWDGLRSTLEDTKKVALREFFQGTFNAIQPLVADFVATLSSEEFKQGLRDAGTELGRLVAAGVKLTQETDWSVISRALKQVSADAAPLEAIFNPKEALEAAAKGYLLASGGLAALNELAKTGEVVEYLQGSGSAAQALRAEVLGLTKDFEQLIKLSEGATSEGAQRERTNIPKRATGGSDVAASPGVADMEQQINLLEKLNDGFEGYSEKRADINEKITKASQDYVKKEQELQGDLAEAYRDLNASRQEAAIDLYTGLTKAEQDYNQTVIEVGQERLRLDGELNASRLEADGEFNEARAKLAGDFNQAVEEIGHQRIDAEATLNEGRLEAEEEFNASRAELEREHSETVFDINRTLAREHEDFNREKLQAEEDFNRERGDLEEKHAQKVRDVTDDILNTERDSADKRLDIQEDLQDRLNSLEDKRKEKTGKIQEDIDEILSRTTARGLGAEGSLSKADQKRLADLRKQLGAETEEFNKQQVDLKAKAEEALQEEADRAGRRLTDLQDKLAQENQAYDDAIAEQQRKFDQQEADRKLSHERAVEDLALRLSRENEAYDRQRGDIQKKLEDGLADLQASYDGAVAKLDERLAKERVKFDEQQAALRGGYEKELIDLQKKHDDATGKLQQRLDQEAIKYAEQRVKLQAAYREEQIDLEASYASRVATVQEKLRDIAVANAEKQLELRDQMRETEEEFQEKIDDISEAWTGKAMDATQQYAEYLAKFQAYLAQTTFPVNFKLNLPDLITPGSPSPLEESLTRTEKLVERLNSTPLTIPTLSTPMMSTPAMLPPVIRGGDTSFANSFGDIVLPSGPLNNAQDARDIARQGAGQIEGLLAEALMQGATRQRGNFRKNFGVRT